MTGFSGGGTAYYRTNNSVEKHRPAEDVKQCHTYTYVHENNSVRKEKLFSDCIFSSLAFRRRVSVKKSFFSTVSKNGTRLRRPVLRVDIFIFYPRTAPHPALSFQRSDQDTRKEKVARDVL